MSTTTLLILISMRHQVRAAKSTLLPHGPHRWIGNFIYQNYRQALEQIQTKSSSLALLSEKLGTRAADYEGYLRDERAHLAGLKAEPPEVLQTADYIEHLVKLEKLLYV